MPIQYNNREQLHKSLDSLIDSAERNGQRIFLLEASEYEAQLIRGNDRKPRSVRFTQRIGLGANSFTPEVQADVGRLEPLAAPWILMVLPAHSLHDFEQWKAEQQPSEPVADTTATTQ